MDPVKLIQTKMRNISQVCLSCAAPMSLFLFVKLYKLLCHDSDSLEKTLSLSLRGVHTPQIAVFQQKQMERVTVYFKSKSCDLERRLKEVSEQGYR